MQFLQNKTFLWEVEALRIKAIIPMRQCSVKSMFNIEAFQIHFFQNFNFRGNKWKFQLLSHAATTKMLKWLNSPQDGTSEFHLALTGIFLLALTTTLLLAWKYVLSLILGPFDFFYWELLMTTKVSTVDILGPNYKGFSSVGLSHLAYRIGNHSKEYMFHVTEIYHAMSK